LDREGKREEPDNLPKKHLYTAALTRDAANMTLEFPIGSVARKEGHVYTQFYSEVKAPFDAAKMYPFENTGYESLAMDPAFVEIMAYAGGVVVFNAKTCEQGYLNTKNRANRNTMDALYKSYGTREEHRISFELCNAIEAQLVEQAQREEPPNCDYYYAVLSKSLFGFLRTQINKYCLGFEYLYTRTAVGAEVEWEKSQLMVYFLRMLRLCYGAHQLGRERELYRDKWEVKDKHGNVVQEKEGLGLEETIQDSGIGWFLPKINWEDWTIREEHVAKLVFDARRIQQAYQRRWQAVGRAYDAFSTIRDARKWAGRFNITTIPANQCQWFFYLFAVNLEQFNQCVLNALKADIRPEFQEFVATSWVSPCWSELSSVMREPHLVVGNRMHYKEGPAKLVDYLFDFDDKQERGAWAKLAYRCLYEGTFKLIEEVLSRQWAEKWSCCYKSFVMVTNWLLPYPCKATLFGRTKAEYGFPSERKWFSSWQSRQAEEFMTLYNTRADSEQGEDFDVLLELGFRHNHWVAGREKVLFGKPLRSKMVLRIQGLSQHAREEYFTTLMS
jgi:hypothetical protein